MTFLGEPTAHRFALALAALLAVACTPTGPGPNGFDHNARTDSRAADRPTASEHPRDRPGSNADGVSPDLLVGCGAGGVCAAGFTCCGGLCVNEDNDPAHCGACGTTYAGSTPYCGSGKCGTPPCFGAPTCTGADTCCGGTCCKPGQLCCSVNRGPATLGCYDNFCPPGCPLCR